MIDAEKAVKAFEKKFSAMSYEERENYLKRIGVEFQLENSEENKQNINVSLNKVKEDYSKLNIIGRNKLLVYLMDTLGYREVTTQEDVTINRRILFCLIPEINFELMVALYSHEREKQIEFLNDIQSLIDDLEEHFIKEDVEFNGNQKKLK